MSEVKTRAERIALKVRRKQRFVRVALGEEKADVVLKNADYVNVFSGTVEHGDIAVANGLVVGMADHYDGLMEVDVSGKIVAPGFIDAHIHLESSLVSPTSFARAVLPHGTTTVITDPHEIANVCGMGGIDYMMAATENLPLDVHFMLPSCVPAMAFEENGAWVLVDYKTDRVDDEQTLVNRYAEQLAWYARALTEITGKPVKERYLYALRVGKAIAVPEIDAK